MLPGGILTPGGDEEPSGVPENVAVTYLNGDGDILVDTCDSGNITDQLSGSATVSITMTKAFSDITYNSYNVYEFGNGDGEKTVSEISGDTITFTDDDVSTHDFYRVGLFDSNNNRVGQTAWNAGFYPKSIKFTLSDGTVKEYEVQVLE